MKRSKKMLMLVSLLCASFINTSCSNKEKLLILNWGEYINDEMVQAFENEYNCEVSISIADSNELFYSKVKGGTTVYDLVVPSDYMVKKMYENDLLQKIDTSKLSNFNQDNFLPGVQGIEEEYSSKYDFKDYYDYQVPYFWGTFGLMYNKQKSGIKEALENYSWDAFFNKDLLPSGTTTGMYNVPRDSYAASMFHLGYSPNEIGDNYLNEVKQDLTKANFDQWGTDELKKQVQKGDLDIAFVYTGDFLDMFYQDMADGDKTIDDITYDIYIPDNTIAFMDSFVLTKNARNVDLAYKFINYFLDPEVAYNNASVVGYCTTLTSSYNKIVDLKSSSDASNQAWSYAMTTYYPILDGEKKYKGTPLINFDKNYLTKVTSMVNDVKTN